MTKQPQMPVTVDTVVVMAADMVIAKDGEVEDTSKFGVLFKKSKHRFRDQIITIVRNSSPRIALIQHWDCLKDRF